MTKHIAVVHVSVDATDEFHFYKQLNEFLRTSFREFAATYNIQDYEVIVKKEKGHEGIFTGCRDNYS